MEKDENSAIDESSSKSGSLPNKVGDVVASTLASEDEHPSSKTSTAQVKSVSPPPENVENEGKESFVYN